MPLSLTCSCGAKLEIDEKFAGKVITCPDCQKEISTAPEPIHARRTSGLAIASLFVSLIGPLTLLLPLTGAVLGLAALGQIARRPHEAGGRRLALAGIILGGVFALLSVVGFVFPAVFPLDGVFREIEWARKLDYLPGKLAIPEEERQEDNITYKINLTRPNFGWGKAPPRLRSGEGTELGDDLILINPWNDAQLTCVSLSYPHAGKEDDQVVLQRAGDRFVNKSELVSYLKGQGEKDRKDEKPPTFRNMKNTSDGKMSSYEMLVEVSLAGSPRTFLLRAVIERSRMFIVAAGTRSAYFSRMEPQFRQLVDSFRIAM